MKYILVSFLTVVMLCMTPIAFAQDGPTGGLGLGGPSGDAGVDGPTGQGGIDIKNPIKAGNLTEFFEMIIDVLLVFAVPLIVFFIIYAGFLYVTARGNEGTIQKAHMALLFAVIGGVIILGAKVLISVISGTVETFQP